MKIFVSVVMSGIFLIAFSPVVMGQGFDGWDQSSEGPWSDFDRITFSIPKVPNGRVVLDGDISSIEYGEFEGMNAIPFDTAWVLDWAHEKNWEGESDASFTFYAAYDDDYLYIGVEALDDTIRSNDPPEAFWKDDAIEILIDPRNLRVDENLDGAPPQLGGHVYFNYEGRFSDWDAENEQKNPERADRFSQAVEWTFGEEGEIWSVGGETGNGWAVEVRFHESLFSSADETYEMAEGNEWDFNVGADDDDGADLSIQYFFASAVYAQGMTAEDAMTFTDDELDSQVHFDFFDTGVNGDGRLKPAGAGEMIFGPLNDTAISDWTIF